jgi:transcription initiation factor IIE alpha subunit
MEQSISCPNCQNKIPFDVRQLLIGIKFTCSVCNTQIGIAAESSSIVEETLNKFEELKSHIKKIE